MKIKWVVEDGYCGKMRPQVTEVNDQDLAECETEEERDELIEQCIQDDFEQKICWHII